MNVYFKISHFLLVGFLIQLSGCNNDDSNGWFKYGEHFINLSEVRSVRTEAQIEISSMPLRDAPKNNVSNNIWRYFADKYQCEKMSGKYTSKILPIQELINNRSVMDYLLKASSQNNNDNCRIVVEGKATIFLDETEIELENLYFDVNKDYRYQRGALYNKNNIRLRTDEIFEIWEEALEELDSAISSANGA